MHILDWKLMMSCIQHLYIMGNKGVLLVGDKGEIFISLATRTHLFSTTPLKVSNKAISIVY